MVDLVHPHTHPHVQLCHWAFRIIPLTFDAGTCAAAVPPVDPEGGGITSTCLGAYINLEGLGTLLEVFPYFQADGGDDIVKSGSDGGRIALAYMES